MWPGNYLQVLFSFQRILCKKESEEVCIIIFIKIFIERGTKYSVTH